MSEDAYKVIIIGAANVGKTSLLIRYVYNEFDHQSARVICEERKLVRARGGSVVLELWDTAGQEKYASAGLNMRFHKNAKAVIIVYDVTDYESYQDATEFWFREAMTYIGDGENTEVPVILVGNKKDLLKNRRQLEWEDDQGEERRRVVRTVDAKTFTDRYHLPPPMECSALSGEKVEEVFRKVATEIINKGLTPHQKSSLPKVRKTDSTCCT